MHERILDALTGGVSVITGNARLARRLHSEFDARQKARGLAAWPSVPILPWTAWLSSLWEEYQFAAIGPPVRLGRWQEWAHWDRIVRSAPNADDLLQAAATAAAAQQTWALAVKWRVDLDRAEAEGGEDAAAFAEWARSFRDKCRQDNLIEEARLPDVLRESIGMLRLPEKALLAGFDEFSPQQEEFFEAVRCSGCKIDVMPALRPGMPVSSVRVEVADAEQGLAGAARWARALVEQDPSTTIGVIVPDLPQRCAKVDRIFRSVLDPATQLPGKHRSSMVNLSAGEPLSQYPLVRSALTILRLRPSGNEWSDISLLLLDPYIAGAGEERADRANIDARLRKGGLSRVAISDVRRESVRAPSCPILARVLDRLEQVWQELPNQQTPAAWAGTFVAALEAAGWPGDRPLDSVEFQTVEAWKDAMSEFAGTDFAVGEVGLNDALSLLARIAGQIAFQPESADAPVQVMGALEAAGMRFDHLWIAGLDDGTWPPPASPDPFLPVRLQREAGVPRCSADQSLAFATKVTDRLLASSPDIVVSYPARDGDRELRPSPLILSLPPVALADLNLWDDLSYAEHIRASRAVERVVDEQGPPVAENAQQRGGVKVFEYQAACPFHAFVELRLAAEDLDSPEPGLDPGSRGTLVHSTLERFWQEVRTQEALCTRRDIPDVIKEAAAWAIERFQARRGAPLPERFAQLERRRLEQLAAEWLEIEKQREPFEVVQPEGEQEAEVGGIRFRLKIDRVDRLRDGSDVIVDYKTNRPSVNEWEGDRPDAPQLPLYSVVHTDHPLAGVAFGVLKPGEMKYRGVVERQEIIPGAQATEIEPRVAEWRGVLEKLAADFRGGVATADPKNIAESCRHCHLAGFCRITDAGISDKEAA